jgi:hypothetical protein
MSSTSTRNLPEKLPPGDFLNGDSTILLNFSMHQYFLGTLLPGDFLVGDNTILLDSASQYLTTIGQIHSSTSTRNLPEKLLPEDFLIGGSTILLNLATHLLTSME